MYDDSTSDVPNPSFIVLGKCVLFLLCQHIIFDHSTSLLWLCIKYVSLQNLYVLSLRNKIKTIYKFYSNPSTRSEEVRVTDE